MCLNTNQKETKRILKLLNRGDQVFYKVVDMYIDYSKQSNELGTRFYSPIYSNDFPMDIENRKTVTVFSSDRRNTKLLQSEVEWKVVHRGIHIYTNLAAAKEHRASNYFSNIIVPVLCKKEDFVAAGFDEAVFKKVYITPKAKKSVIDLVRKRIKRANRVS